MCAERYTCSLMRYRRSRYTRINASSVFYPPTVGRTFGTILDLYLPAMPLNYASYVVAALRKQHCSLQKVREVSRVLERWSYWQFKYVICLRGSRTTVCLAESRPN